MRLSFALLATLCWMSASAQDVFQQDVAYTIDVQLDDEKHMLNGDFTLEYTNNSPDTLHQMRMHIWPNAYKNGRTELAKQQIRQGNTFMFYALSKQMGFIDSLEFKVNGVVAKWTYHPQHIDIAWVELAEPLLPGQALTLETPFRIKLPTGKISRLGHIGQSYQLTQWYPKPAVYDHEGWHDMPYLNQGEFFSEYGTYDVRITLPENYVVGATGDLVDCPSEVAFMDSLAQLSAGQTEFRDDMEFPPSSSKTKTLHFHQEEVHDFAWFTDKRYNVLKGEVELPGSGRTVTTWALFTNKEGKLWSKSIAYLNDATYYYSLWNGDYPYNHVTAVDGTISAGGGMEYPNITVIGESGTDMSLETVIVHEVGHNWFYGILGSNERENAWMDEGINSYNETRYFRTKYKDELGLIGSGLPAGLKSKLDLDQYSYRSRDEIAYLLTARNYLDQPMQCHSNHFTSINYGTVVYKKTAVAMDYLAGYLGQEEFDRCMQVYFEQWKFNHPAPNDLRATLEKTSGKDLSWFFEELITTDAKPDYRIIRTRTSGDVIEVRVKNVGGVPGPFQLSGLLNDSIVAESWFDGVSAGQDTTVVLTAAELDQVRIDGREQMLEFDRKDNTASTKGLLRRLEPLQIRALSRIDDPNHTQLFWLPLIAWNQQDKGMAGALLHNMTIPGRNLQWYAAPLYSFATGQLNGMANITHVKNRWESALSTRRFTDRSWEYQNQDLLSWYMRSSLSITRRSAADQSRQWNSIGGLEVVHLYDHVDRFRTDQDGGIHIEVTSNHVVAPRLFVDLNAPGALLEQDLHLEIRFALLSLDDVSQSGALPMAAQANYHGRRQYNANGRDVHWYGFAATTGRRSFLPLTGYGRNGQIDPLRDGLLLQRGGNNSLLSQQITGTQGAFGRNIYAGSYLVSAAVEVEAPVRLPVSFFGAVYAYDMNNENHTDWSAGVSFPIVRDLFEIHMPLVGSNMFEETYNVGNYVRFELHLEKINPFKALRKVGL